ncbi:MAG: glycosyltransferase family 4 protein [Gemmiger sp.]
MLTIGIPQLYCGTSGQKGAYNLQAVGLARAFASLGCRAVAFYPRPGASEPEIEDVAPNVRVVYLPCRHISAHSVYKSWQPLLDEGVQVVHSMSDNQLGIPALYRFCKKHGIFFYNQIGIAHSDSANPAVRRVMDLLARRNLRVYRETPAFAKTPAVAAELESLGVPCAGVLPVGLDTAIIPQETRTRAQARADLGLDAAAKYLIFVGRIDSYKRPLDLAPLLAALPGCWRAVIIGQGALDGALDEALAAQGVSERCLRIPRLPNEQVHGYYRACDVFVNLNDQEIFGMSLLEAMYAGCPPVARHAPGPDCIIEDGVSGLLADGIPALAAAVQRAAEGPAMGEAAAARVRERFLWQSSAQTVLAMLAANGIRP